MATQSVVEWLTALQSNDEIRYRLVQSVREIVLQVGPSIGEEIKYGGILFAGRRGFCGIFSYANHVTLEFSEGAKLLDPHQRLKGKGKGRRHLKLGSISDIQTYHVRDFVALAYLASQSS